jgi:hypothetical protein
LSALRASALRLLNPTTPELNCTRLRMCALLGRAKRNFASIVKKISVVDVSAASL